MNTTTTTPRPVLLGERLHCPKCANELDIWEETRQLDRIDYTAPRWDAEQTAWTYTRTALTNESVELLDRYAQCVRTGCVYVAQVEDRHDETGTIAPDELAGCTYVDALAIATNNDRVWHFVDDLEKALADSRASDREHDTAT